jgi:hypothetical protein
MHFAPTSSSWLNMVERFFRDLTQNRLRRGVFRDVEELITAIGDCIDHHNLSPNLSSGPPAPLISWKRSNMPATPYINVNLNDALHYLTRLQHDLRVTTVISLEITVGVLDVMSDTSKPHKI